MASYEYKGKSYFYALGRWVDEISRPVKPEIAEALDGLYSKEETETDIPFNYQDGNLTIKALMKIKLLKRYKADRFTFDVLKEKYGIFAVRGPRGIPNSLSVALK